MHERKRKGLFRGSLNENPEKNMSTGWTFKGFIYFILLLMWMGIVKFLFF